jgi:hypothetical protein
MLNLVLVYGAYLLSANVPLKPLLPLLVALAISSDTRGSIPTYTVRNIQHRARINQYMSQCGA